MKRRIRQLSAIFLSLFLLFSVSSAIHAEVLTLVSTDYPPYSFSEPQDGLRGFDVEVVEAAFEQAQVSTETKFLPWKRALEETKHGIYTAIYNCSFRKEREEFLIYSTSISRQSIGFFIRSNFNGFEPTRLEDAKGLKVGSVLGWAMADTMKDAGADIVTFRTEELVFRDLLKGLIDYAYLSLESSGFGAMKLGISNKIRTIKIQEKKLYVCFSKKWPNIEGIIDKFNEGLAAVRKDGSYDRIHARYR